MMLMCSVVKANILFLGKKYHCFDRQIASFAEYEDQASETKIGIEHYHSKLLWSNVSITIQIKFSKSSLAA
jgi:hypothetical protein